ncbi:Acetyl-CoA synthetase-like protein [Mycena venus]|uniref:Acetyl-CoA synthetase-like protein n=1 Tax=Mycena venus TaxID=2733690 RepID=A0A8H7CYG7_9AGAR|nr:Acetyl-CoA synthetase-like protein [Mycena venus]
MEPSQLPKCTIGMVATLRTIDYLCTHATMAQRGRYSGLKQFRPFRRGARILRKRFAWMPGMNELPVVGILAASDAIPYFVLFMSCLRANYVVFPISPRNSPSAVAHLLDKAAVDHLLIGHDPAMLALATDANQILKEKYSSTVVPDISYVPLFEDLFNPDSTKGSTPEDLPYEYRGPDSPAVICHSSGSTRFPSPIWYSQHRMIQLALIPWFGERDLTNQVLSLHSMPMYHGMGFTQTVWSASCGLVLSAFEPKPLPTVPNPENHLLAARATNSDIIFAVPAFLEARCLVSRTRMGEMARKCYWRGASFSSAYWSLMRKLSFVQLYGGGPLNKQVGDYLSSQGVSIFVLYGSSEGGMMSVIIPGRGVDFDWDYFTFPELITAEMVPHGDNKFEFVMVANHFSRPTVVNTTVRGVEAYASSDLMEPHPTKTNYWKIFGRADDQIMHNTGEKTNPGPLENILNQDPHISACVMFGRGRFLAGVIIDPKPNHKFDPSDPLKLAQFRNLIWPTVEKLNAFAPQHSRLFKEVNTMLYILVESLIYTFIEMMLVSKPNKPFTYTAKSTARRQAIILDYEDEIADLYDAVEETTRSGISPPAQWDPTSTPTFVRNVVHKVLVNDVEDDADLFRHGCDSLQATWIRNSLLRALRDSAQIETRQTTHNFVYDHPSISSLAAFVLSLVSGKVQESSSLSSETAMNEMVFKSTHNFPKHTGKADSPSSGAKVVVVTGTTGELGCYLLSQLVNDSSVRLVYALNRASRNAQSLRERQTTALIDRGLEADILDSEKVVLLEGDLSAAQFNMAKSVYQKMQETVTHVIHAAWPVDFNLTLRSFEDSVNGLRNLVDFSLGSPFKEPPTLIYTSSIGIFQNVTEGTILAEKAIEAKVAAGSGYTESKWVAEQILAKAEECTPLKSVTVRVGQLCGGLNGAWNINEWFPALVQASSVVQHFPDSQKDVNWLPVDVAAAAIVDFLAAVRLNSVVNLVHPHPVSWSVLCQTLSTELSVSIVPYPQWLSLLEDACKTHEKKSDLRASRLIEFFRSLRDPVGSFKTDIDSALHASPSLRSQMHPLQKKDVQQWLLYWQNAALL